MDKCPGVRPIGIGETVRRIMGRAILSILREDIKKAVGPIQLCAGQEAGCEAAVHAIHKMFDDSTTDAVLLVDATKLLKRINSWQNKNEEETTRHGEGEPTVTIEEITHQPKKSCRNILRERSFILDDCPPYRRTWLSPSQRGIP